MPHVVRNGFYSMVLALAGAGPGLCQDQMPHRCGTDEYRYDLVKNDVVLRQRITDAYERLEQFTEEFSSLRYNKKQDTAGIYIIPVVFHVIHDWGPENISDAQIYDQIRILNEDFRKRNPDTNQVVAAFKGIIADCEIEFRLAQRDPDGNCTKGINRIAHPYTHTGGDEVKTLIQWPPDRYLNIWVVAKEPNNLAGYALLPPEADTVTWKDGIVMLSTYIGTSDPSRSTVVTHEVGHYFNLQHTWGGNNRPGIMYYPPGDTSNCSRDDGVGDTPNTVGWTSCNLTGTSCGSLDNVQNYMEYAYCAKMFTGGQKQRMRAALNSPVAGRNNLWQPANLAATGTDDTDILCAADFNAGSTVVCEGDAVIFTDVSYHGVVTMRSWSFPGGSPASGMDSVMAVTYNNAGLYDVSLQAGNADTTVSVTRQKYITVLPATGKALPYTEGFEYSDSLPAVEWIAVSGDTAVRWMLNDTVFYGGSGSVSLGNFSNVAGSVDELISTTIDLSGRSGVTLSFYYAFARRTDADNDKFSVAVSNNCGKTWLPRLSIFGASLATVPKTVAPFAPQSPADWKLVQVTNISSAYLVPGFRFKFSFTAGGGNNLYMDNINLSDPSGLNDPSGLSFPVEITPNPVRDEASVRMLLPKSGELSVAVYDCAGRLVKVVFSGRLQAGEQTVPVAVGNMENGVYFVHVRFDGRMAGRRVFVLR